MDGVVDNKAWYSTLLVHTYDVAPENDSQSKPVVSQSSKQPTHTRDRCSRCSAGQPAGGQVNSIAPCSALHVQKITQ